MPDHRDLATTEDLLVEALVDAQSYRVLAQEAIHALHDLIVERDRLRQQHHQLCDEYRRLRESLLTEAVT